MLANAQKECDNNTTSGPGPEIACTTRYANENDLAKVLGLYMTALKEINDPYVKPNAEKCARQVLFAWSQAPCVLLEKLGEIIGFAGLKTVIPDHSDQNIISEYMFYIKPEHRSIKLAKMLSDEVQAVADRFGLPLYFTHRLNGLSVDHKEKFLKRWGYEPVAVNCVYGGSHGR